MAEAGLWAAARRNARVRFGAAVFGLLVLAAFGAPLLAPHNPLDQDLLNSFLPPFWRHGADPAFPGYAIRPPGEYLVWLKAAGTDNILLQAGPLTLNAGDVYSFVLAQNQAGDLELRAVKEH